MSRALSLLAVAAVLGGCGGDEESAPTTAPAAREAQVVTSRIDEVDGSGISGTATLTPQAGKRFAVAVRLNGTGDGASHPAHIHDVTCDEYAKLTDFDAQLATVKDSLSNVTDGVSQTTVGLTELSERTTGGYSINVHAPESPFPAVACGDIPKR
jgi:hypothetical protein